MALLRRQLRNAGGDDAKQIQLLRVALASSEDGKKLHAVLVCVEELAEIVPDRLLDRIADLRDRCHEKLTRLDVPTPVQRAYHLDDPDGRTLDDHGVDRLLEKLLSVHGDAGRHDIAPELLAALAGRKGGEARRP
jgi:hypothetical protein